MVRRNVTILENGRRVYAEYRVVTMVEYQPKQKIMRLSKSKFMAFKDMLRNLLQNFFISFI